MYNDNEYNQVHLNGNIIKILWRQQQELLKKSPEYVTPIINNEDPIDIQIDLEGPKATPYEGGIFRVKLIIPNEFPIAPPKGIFITKIFHPNISEKGDICVNTLQRDWNSRQWSLYNLFEVIKCLLIVPFPESALNEEAGKIFMENYDEYFKIAKMYTKIYAMKNNNKEKSDKNEKKVNDNIEKTNNIKEDEDIEMEDNCNNKKCNQFNNTQNDIHIKNNIFENIGKVEYRRMTEMPKSYYNLEDNLNNITKANDYFLSYIKDNNNNITHFNMNNNNNNFVNNMSMNLNYNCFNNNFKDNLQNRIFLSSKEKPNLSFLPLMNANQIKKNNKNFGYHRSQTFNNNSQNNINGNNYSSSQEINKWIMRI